MGDARGPVTATNQPSTGYSSYDYNSSYNYGAGTAIQPSYGTNNTPVTGNQQWNRQSASYGQSSDQYSYPPPSHYAQQNQVPSTQYGYSGSQYGGIPPSSMQTGYNLGPTATAPPPPPPIPGTHSSGPPYSGSYSSAPPGGYHDNSGAGGHQGMRSQPSYRGGLGGGRNAGPGFNKGRGSGYGGYESKRQEEVQDTVFVSGLPEDATEAQIAEYFGSIGVIKNDKKTGKPKIWIYRDKHSGKSKGEATVTYDDPPTANSSITWFNGKDFLGNKIKVEMAQRKQPMGGFGGRSNNRGGGRMDRGDHAGGMGMGGGGRSGGSSGGGGRQGDWPCPNPGCNNNNFSWRTHCNRCQAPKPDGAGSGAVGNDGAMTPQVVDSRRNSSMIPPIDSRRNGGGTGGGGGSGGMRGGRGGRGGGGNMGGGFNRGGGRGGGGRGGGPGAMRGRSGGPMRGGHDRRPAPY